MFESEIWIPSKGRPGSVFSKKLCDAGISHTVWVEPQDFEKYRQALTHSCVTYRVIDKNDQGVTYVRQQMLNDCRSKKLKIFMMDDDIKCFLRVQTVPGKAARVKKPMELQSAFWEAERVFVDHALAYGSFVFSIFAHWGEEGLTTKKMDTGSVWLDGSKIPTSVNYDDAPGREDLYFATMLMLSGAVCGKYFDIAVDHAPVALPAMKGGLANWYANWQNVIDANERWMKALDEKKNQMLTKLPTAVAKKFDGKSLYKVRTIRMGERKGCQDTSPHWRNIVALRNAFFDGELKPV